MHSKILHGSGTEKEHNSFTMFLVGYTSPACSHTKGVFAVHNRLRLLALGSTHRDSSNAGVSRQITKSYPSYCPHKSYARPGVSLGFLRPSPCFVTLHCAMLVCEFSPSKQENFCASGHTQELWKGPGDFSPMATSLFHSFDH